MLNVKLKLSHNKQNVNHKYHWSLWQFVPWIFLLNMITQRLENLKFEPLSVSNTITLLYLSVLDLDIHTKNTKNRLRVSTTILCMTTFIRHKIFINFAIGPTDMSTSYSFGIYTKILSKRPLGATSTNIVKFY